MIPDAPTLPPVHFERVTCSIAASMHYQIPANLLLAVAEMEGGKPGQAVKNENGTFDLGVMQLNTSYVNELKKYGITYSDVSKAGCYPYFLAAWRLRGHIDKDKGDVWTRVANYHSRTPEFNQRYRAKLIPKADRWAMWLKTHYKTN